MSLYNKNKARGDIFKEKRINEQFCQNKESNNDPIESNAINQSCTVYIIMKLLKS